MSWTTHPHWSKLLISHMTPWMKILCSYMAVKRGQRSGTCTYLILYSITKPSETHRSERPECTETTFWRWWNLLACFLGRPGRRRRDDVTGKELHAEMNVSNICTFNNCYIWAMKIEILNINKICLPVWSNDVARWRSLHMINLSHGHDEYCIVRYILSTQMHVLINVSIACI